MSPSPLLLGVTATPDRGDQRGLAEVFSEITYQKTILEMIAAGYLCNLRAKQVKVKADFSALSIRAGDFRADEVAEVLMDGQAPELVAQAVVTHAPDRRTLAFTPTVAVAHALADELRQRGVVAEAIDGTTPIDQRRDVLQRFASGEVRAVCNCAVLTEGYDGPFIDCIVIARPTRSRPLYVQMVGRGTRPYPEKLDCLVLDVVGATTRHDLVTMSGLAGVDPAAIGEQTVTEALDKVRGQPAPAGTWAAELAAKDVDLFNRREMNWIKAGTSHILSTWDGHIALEPVGGAWAVVRHQRDVAPVNVAKGLTLEWAQGTAEDLVRKLGAGALVDRKAAWRSRPASDKQLDTLRRMRIRATPGITCGEASDLISAGIVRWKGRSA